MAKSMTSGNPMKLIFNFSLPLLFGNLFQQLYNIIDASIVGKVLGSNALAAVGASSSVQFLVLGFCIGICAGFGVPVAQRFGAESFDSLKNFVYNGALITAGIGIFLTVLTAILCPTILRIMSTPDAIYQDAYNYLLIIFLGIPCTLLYNYLAGILRAIGDSKTPFYFLVFSACLNIVLDLFCIIVLGWGCAGAAIATITAQGISGLLCLAYIIKKVEVLHLAKKNRHLSRRRIGQLLYMGLPMGLQFSITAIGSMMIQSSNNGLGTVYVSAFTAGMRIKQFAMCPFDAIATAVSTFAGQNYGAGKAERIKRGIKDGVIMGVVYGAIMGVILFFFGKTFTLLFISKEETEIILAAGQYIGAYGIFFWMLGILNTTRMSTQGLGYSNLAIICGILELFARALLSIFIVPKFGFWGICAADPAAWIVASLYASAICIYAIKQCEKKIERREN
ncbi:MAG: MATE family efflux transporter [Lachnospiraceae bacterium]|nr:MATE family efflux transporter [Lachnospiraceae bacterium]